LARAYLAGARGFRYGDALGLRGSLLRFVCFGACLSLGVLAVLGSADRVLSFSVIFVAVVVYGAFRSPMVMLADVVALEHTRAAGTTYGKLRLYGSVGFLVAALLVGRALDPRAAAPLPATIATPRFVALLADWTLSVKYDRPRLPVTREALVLVTAPDFVLFLATSLLAQLAHSSYDLCFSLHLRGLGVPDRGTGIAWAVGVVFEVALMALAEPLMTQFSAPSLLVFALLGASVRWALIVTYPPMFRTT
jgi:MFS transporter, PPP family, 3-phenylpropionic acid transporter